MNRPRRNTAGGAHAVIEFGETNRIVLVRRIFCIVGIECPSLTEVFFLWYISIYRVIDYFDFVVVSHCASLSIETLRPDGYEDARSRNSNGRFGFSWATLREMTAECSSGKQTHRGRAPSKVRPSSRPPTSAALSAICGAAGQGAD